MYNTYEMGYKSTIPKDTNKLVRNSNASLEIPQIVFQR